MKSTIFAQLFQAISRKKFQKIVDSYGGDRYVKSFTSWCHLKFMVYFQISGRTSIRDGLNSLNASQDALYHSGIKQVSRNDLSHQNSKRDYRIFQEAFYCIRDALENKSGFRKKHKFRFKHDLSAVDSTTISLCKELFGWAKFRATKAGIKLHTVLSLASYLPEVIHMTEAKVNDMKALWDIKIKSNTVYVLDRAYLCIKWLVSVVNEGSFFVLRLKTNSKYRVTKRSPVSEYHKKRGVLLDRRIKLTGVAARRYTHEFRHVRFKCPETGKVFNFVTNLFDLSPLTIAEIYHERWQIELFFKQIKQNLKIKAFIGRSENAVLVQVWTAMIALLLFEWAKYISRVKMGLKEFLSLIANNIFARKALIVLMNTNNPAFGTLLKSTEHQLSLF